MVIVIYYLYKADMPSRSEITIQGRPRSSNVPPVTKIGGYIDNRTTSTGVSIITIIAAIPVATK